MDDDLVLVNGAVYTQDPARPEATAVAIRGGRILAVGDDATARAALPDAEVVDLGGRRVLPGLADAHLHLGWYGLALSSVQAETPTLDEALERVAARAAETPPGTWITGRGWNHNAWGGEFPTAADLDRVAPDHPVYLSTKSGHAGWANTRALAVAGVSAVTPDPDGGRILRDAAGRPTGILLEEAMGLVADRVPEPTVEEMAAAVSRAATAAARAGLTGVHDMDDILTFRAEQILHAAGELPLRVVKSVPLGHLDAAIETGLRSGFGDEWLRIGAVKMFTDGALGPRTAWMLEPFQTEPPSTGIATTPLEALCDGVRRAGEAGLGCAIHAIGDRACREVLAIYEEALRERPLAARGPAARLRIEHLQILHPDDVPRVARLGVIASMQPIHATSDMEISDRHLGARASRAYVFRSLLAAGATLAFGSDCPVEVVDPLVGLHAAVTRRRADGSPGPDGWHPEQRLTVAEAVRAYTVGPAYAAGREDRLGVIAPGFLGDLTILEEDILRVDPQDIAHAGVAGTVVGGRFTFRSDGL